MIAIVGAGLTGLSTAYHLKNRSYRIFEQGDTPGGLCRSTQADGFTFDYTGHLLYIKNPYTHRMLKNILPEKFIKIIRKSAVYYKSRYLPYPFQANTYGLPKEVVFECVMGFVDAYMNRKKRKRTVRFLS